MRWPRDKRARNGYYSTIYLYGSGLSTDNEPQYSHRWLAGNHQLQWRGLAHGAGPPMSPVAAFDPSRYDSYQTGAMIHEGIHCNPVQHAWL